MQRAGFERSTHVRRLTATPVVPLLLTTLMTLTGCDDPTPVAVDSSPEVAALALLEARVVDDRIADPWNVLFDEVSDASTIDLLEAIEALPTVVASRVTRVDLDLEGREAFVDMDGELPGGGSATFSVRLRCDPEARWRIVWFQGPALEWPLHTAKGDGLSQSAPPGPPTR
jgi:hypothetical protein